MKVYETSDIRNVALIGHGHSGKTSLVAGLLFSTGATSRLTRVDEGNTVTDFDDEETAAQEHDLDRQWPRPSGIEKDQPPDMPGFNLFINDTKAALAAADAMVLIDGVAGVEVQTEKVWGFAEEFTLPRAIVINKLDRERSSFERSLESVQSNFGRNAVPIQLPIGSERDFKGIVDLVRMKAYTYTPDGDGKGKEGDIPGDISDAAQKAHEALIEMVAEGNDELLEEFFAEGTLPVQHIIDGLRQEPLCQDMPHLSSAVQLGAPQCRFRSDSEFHYRVLPGPGRAHIDHRNFQWKRGHATDQGQRTRVGLGV